jgi:5-methylcytosine-specific restriction endonuclease McrA
MRNDILEKKEQIIEWVNDNQSKAFICREIKCKPLTLDLYLKKMGIEYKGNMGLKGKKIAHNRSHVSTYLVKGSLIQSYKLKKRLIRDGVKETKCEICGITKWNDKDVPLEVHHIDGDGYNNELNNIQLVCPNCHAQTDTYRGMNTIKFKNRNK